MRRVSFLAVWLAAAPLAAQDAVEPEAHQFPRDSAVNRNPYVVAGDAAYSRRQEGRVGEVADGRRISEAIVAYQTAAEAPDNVEARWKLLRAFYFKGVYTGLDPESRLAVFVRARHVSDDSLGILARRSGHADWPEVAQLPAASRAETLSGRPEAAATLYWAAACLGQWALAVGKDQAASSGAAEQIRDEAVTVIAIDPQFEDGGGYRVLGRLHDQAADILVLKPWISREEALRNLRLAVSVGGRNFANRHYLAEALARGGADEREQAVALEAKIVRDGPSPQHLVEDLAIQAQAARNLEQWKKNGAQ